MVGGDNEWGDDEDDQFFLFDTQPQSPVFRIRDDPPEPLEVNVKEEPEEDENTEWGPDEDDDLLVHASQKVEEMVTSPLCGTSAGPNGALPEEPGHSSPVIPSKAFSRLKSREQESEDRTNAAWGDEGLRSELEIARARNEAITEQLYAVMGENSTLRRKMESTNDFKSQIACERVQKEIEAKKREAEKKREAASEKEKLNSELASQKMEVFKLQWKVKHAMSRDTSIRSPQNDSASTSMRFPTGKSVLNKGYPPVPKFSSRSSVTQQILQMVGEAPYTTEKPTAKEVEIERRDFSLRKPAILSDYDNDEYRWENGDHTIEDNCFLNLSNNSSNTEAMEEDLSDNSDNSSDSSDDSFADWEEELAQNPIPPIPPAEPHLDSTDHVINWIKQDSRNDHSLSTLESIEEKQNSVLEKLVDLATSRAPWVQSFGYIQANVDHRFESLKTLVEDVARLAPRGISDVEIGTVDSDVENQSDEGRLWKWYLKHIDKKHQEGDRRKQRISHMPSNCGAGPSMKFLEYINHLPTEPLSAWSLLSHIRVQLEDLIWIADIRNEWRIYNRDNLETFLKLIMWASELWPYVLEEESSPEIVQSHLPHWQTELRSWTAALLEIGNGDFLFNGKFQRTILSLVLEVFAKIMKTGYFHATASNYKKLSNIVKLACCQHTWLNCKILMDICSILKYGFKDNQFMNLLCGGVNESLCLMDEVSSGFLESYAKEKDSTLKAKMFFEYVSTLNLLMHKEAPVYFSSKLSRARLIEKKTNTEIEDVLNEYEMSELNEKAWLHPDNWEDPDKCKGLCQCRKVLCGNVIIMFSDIVPLWRDAVYNAEAQLVALQKQHKMEDDNFLKQHEVKKTVLHQSETFARGAERLGQQFNEKFEQYKKNNKKFKNAQLNFSFEPSDLPKMEEYMRNLDAYENQLMEFNEKKATLILRRRDYKKDIMTQGLLDNEVFSNWTQVGKLLRKRLGVHLPWWLKRYEREPTIFDQAIEVGMIFMYHFLNCSNLASALGDEGLRDFLIVSSILKAHGEDFLTNDRMAPIIRELTTINSPQYSGLDDSFNDSSASISSTGQRNRLSRSHKLIYENGNRILKCIPNTDEHLPDLKQSDLNRQKNLLDLEKQDLAKKEFSLKSLNRVEKSTVMQNDDVLWMRKLLDTKNISEIIRPTGNQSNALSFKQFSLAYRKSSNTDGGSKYLNENGEDTTPQRHKRDKSVFLNDLHRSCNLEKVTLNYVSETERSYLEKEGGQSGSESILLLNDTEDMEIDNSDLKSYFLNAKK